MKNLHQLPNAKTLFFAFFACSFLLLSCSNKVSNYLNEADGIISKYEDKGKDFSFKDRDRMVTEVNRIDEEFKLKVGKEPYQWTNEQQVRRIQFGARIEKLNRTAVEYEQEQNLQRSQQ